MDALACPTVPPSGSVPPAGLSGGTRALERHVRSLAQQKLAFQQKRLAATQQKRAAFDVDHPDFSLAQHAADAAAAQQAAEDQANRPKKLALIGAGVLAAGVAGFFVWRKFRK